MIGVMFGSACGAEEAKLRAIYGQEIQCMKDTFAQASEQKLSATKNGLRTNVALAMVHMADQVEFRC